VKRLRKITNTSAHKADLNDGRRDLAVTKGSVEMFFSLLRILHCCLFKFITGDGTAVVSCLGLILRGGGAKSTMEVRLRVKGSMCNEGVRLV